MRRNRCVQHAAAVVVGARHAADQGVVVAEGQEIGGGALDVPRRVAQDAGPQRPRRRDERGGADEVAEPQARKDRFGEGADVDDPPGFIHGFQGGGGGAEEGHLEFIIILDDQHIVSLGPVEQRLTPGVGHGGGRGALVAGGGEDDVGVGGDGRGVEAVLIERQGGQGGMGLLEERAEGGVAGILDRGVAARGEQLGGEPEGVLRAHGEEDLIGGGEDATAWQGLAGDEVDQQRVVAVVLVGGEAVEVAFPKGLHGAEPPVGAVEERGVGLAVDEVVAVLRPVGGFGEAEGRWGGQELAPVDRAGTRGAGGKIGRFGGVGGDVVAGAAPGCEIVVGDKFGVGQRDGDAGDVEVGGQSAGGGEAVARAEAAGQDALGHHLLNARLQGAGGVRGEVEGVDGDHGVEYAAGLIRRQGVDLWGDVPL